MFEKEVMISSLKKNNQMLSKLVQEMEDSSKTNLYDIQYFQETIKRIESALRKLRKINDQDASPSTFAYKYTSAFNNRSWQ